MGTRADFYVGRGENAEWLGSVAWDGYPSGFDAALFKHTNETEWRAAVSAMLASRDDATLPERGWPWPWDDSQMTDYAYAFALNAVHASSFGHAWFDPQNDEPEGDDEGDTKPTVFPNMKARKNVRWDKGSGVIVVSVPKHDP